MKLLTLRARRPMKTAVGAYVLFLLFAPCVPCRGAEPGSFSSCRGSDGSVHTVWVEGRAAEGKLYYRLITGESVSAPEQIAPGKVSGASPAVAVDKDGAVWAAWSSASGGAEQVFAARRAGEGWSEPVRVSADKPYPALLPNFYERGSSGLVLSYLAYNGLKYVQREAYLYGGEWLLTPAHFLKSAPGPDAPLMDTNKYVGFGDSVTAGFTEETGWSGEGYKPRLEELLRGENPGARVILSGVGGERTITGVNRIDSVLARKRAGHILIFEGINDIQWRISHQTILFNLGEMADKAREFGTVPVVAVLPPRDDARQLLSDTEHFNDNYLRPYLMENGILVADLWKFFLEQPDWKNFIDRGGQHPNPAGYDLIGESWFIALEPGEAPSGLYGWVDSGCAALSWDPDYGYGHEGYNVYRKDGAESEFVKVNPELVAETFFRDCAPDARHVFYYAVTSVDRNGNESDYSESVTVDFSSSFMCFIASAVFGGEGSREVEILCGFRDDVLLRAGPGRKIVEMYYKFSPAGVSLLEKYPFLKPVIRLHLAPAVRLSSIFLRG